MTREEAIKQLLDAEHCLAGHGDLWDTNMEAFEMAIKALEQEPILDRDCEHCSKTYGTFGCCTTVSNKLVYSCKDGQREYILDKIRAEIEAIEDGISSYHHDRPWIFKDEALAIIDKYRTGGGCKK